MATANTDFGAVAQDLQRAAASFALLTSSATAFGAALQSFRQFERQLVLTNAIAGGTVAQFEEMSRAARDFSLVTTSSAIEAGRALQQLAQAGFSAQESLNAMNGVLLLSQATLTDVAVASDVLASNIRAFRLSTSDTTRVANVFTAAITSSLASMDKLAFAFRQVSPVAELAGLSIEETTAALGVLFNVGLRGEQAGTALRNIIIRLVRPLGEASDILREAGVATRTTTGELRNLEEILKDIAVTDIGDAELARIFETEAVAAVKAFINALTTIEENGKDVYTNLREEITDTDRALELAVKNLDTFDGALKLFNNTISDVAKDVGSELAPIIISLTEFVRNLVESFRELEPATQSLILQIAGLTTAAIGVLSIINALVLLLRGAGVIAFSSWAAGIAGATISLGGVTSALGTFLTRVGAVVVGLRPLNLALGTTVTTLSGGLVPAIGRAAASIGAFVASLRTLGIAGLILSPAGLMVTGAAAIAAGIGSVIFAVDALNVSLSEIEDQINRVSSVEFEIARANTQEFVDRILPQGVVTEVASRVEQVRAELRLLEFAPALDRARTTGRRQDFIGEQVNRTAEILQSIKEENEQVFEIIQRERAIKALLNDPTRFDDLNNFQSILDSVSDFLGQGRDDLVLKGLQLRIKRLSEAERAALAALRPEVADLLDLNRESADLVEELQRQERAAIQDLLIQIEQGEAQLGDDLALAVDAIRKSGILSQDGVISALSEALAEQEGPVDAKQVLRAALEEAGVAEEDIIDLLTVEQQRRTAKLITGLEDLTAEIEQDFEDVRIAILEQELSRTENLAEALRLATEIGNAKLEDELNDLSAQLREDFDKILIDFGLNNIEGINDAVAAAAAEAGLDVDSIPGLSSIVSGEAIVDAISAQIDEDTSQEEAEAILAAEIEKWEEIFRIFIEQLIAAGTIGEAEADAIRQAFAASVGLLEKKALEGIGETGDELEKQRENQRRREERAEREAERRQRERERAARKREREAEKALRQAREIEDLFRQADDLLRESARTVFESAPGIGIQERAAALLELDVDAIRDKYEDQIIDLERQLADLERNFEGPRSELDALRNRYETVIEAIKRARDAEIAAANSFDAQMKRRSQAIDLFIRDLRTVAFESQSTFTKVGAGVAEAFAEYTRDLVTLVDITRDAVSEFLDATTTLVADFIFDNENAWENFKKTMLRISRQIFEGFTKAFLQQAISSITGGPGSIFGNQLQPSPFGNEGVPTVGTGGIFGQLFGGLFGGNQQQQQQTAGGVNVSPLQQTIQKVSVDTERVYQQGLTQTEGVLQRFTSGLNAAFQGAIGQVNSTLTGMGLPNVPTGGLPGGSLQSIAAVPGVGTPMATTGAIAEAAAPAVSTAVNTATEALGATVTASIDGLSGEFGRAVLAVVQGESAGNLLAAESSAYSPGRARQIFSAASRYSDAQLRQMAAAGPEVFFEAMYGPGTGPGRALGNVNPGDGGRFYGRGPIQLTGRANYERYGRITGLDIVNNPDLLTTDPNAALAVTTAYLEDRVKRTGDIVGDVRAAVAGGRGTRGYEMNIAKDRARFAQITEADVQRVFGGAATELTEAGTELNAASSGLEEAGTELGNLANQSQQAGTAPGQPQQVQYDRFGNPVNVPLGSVPGIDPATGQPIGSPVAGGGATGNIFGGGTPATAGTPGVPGVPGAPGQGGGLQQQAQQFSQVFQQFVQQITQTLNQFGNQFANALNQVVQGIQQMAQQLGVTGAGGIGTVSFSGITAPAAGAGVAGAAGTAGAAGAGAGLFGGGNFLGGILGFASQLFGFSDGGKVQGDGTETSDSILSLLSKNEYVVNAAATKKFLPLLEAINAQGAGMSPRQFEDIIQGFATGGLVGSGGDGFKVNSLIDPFDSLSRDPIIPSNITSGPQDRAGDTINNRQGDSINLNVTYNMRGAAGQSPDSFRRSSSQHAKALMAQIERAKRNT